MLFFILYFSIKNEHDLEPIWHVHVPLTLCNEFITLEFILFDIIQCTIARLQTYVHVYML